MIPELGHYALILALVLSFVQAIFPLAGTFNGNRNWVMMARSTALTQFALVTISFFVLVNAFLVSDFSVAYVAQNSNTLLPDIYKISAVWGAHEGSLLLWALMLSGWTAAVAVFSRNMPEEVVARVLSVMGFISIGFLLFMLLTSNPFERLYPVPLDGRDLNPLLQDFGLAIHPPMLYMGYVGFSVAFGFAIAALIGGKLDAAWARWSRPWTTVAWAFLTIGIVLGSWWAYYELGWGGWWFWDPVENASFMPWLVGTALMHSLAVTEKRGAFKRWTVLLAIFAFSLSLLGTFLVRSGVLTSVHSFAADPERGLFILAFLVLVVGGSLTLYALRAPSVNSGGVFELVSRETFLLGNNLFLSVSALAVLIGTLAPLIFDFFELGKISVGKPYFDFIFSLLMVPLLFILGFGPLMRWKRSDPKDMFQSVKLALLAAVLAGLLFTLPILDGNSWQVGLAVFLGVWITATLVESLVSLSRGKRRSFIAGLKTQSRSYYGMQIAHFGVAMCVIGVAVVSMNDIERDISMAPGQEAEMAGYTFRFIGVNPERGPNYLADRGRVQLLKDGKVINELYPEKRVYQAQSNPMTEAAIDAGFFRDVYVSLGENLGGEAWAVRLYYKPYVRWIWLGGLLMALGGFLAVTDRRYRLKVKTRVGAAVSGSVA